MNHAGQRATGAGAERHAIGVTRMCLRSGSVQLPFALAGRLPEGELLAHDAVADEAVVLWSDPPRRLAGLAALFERHEVQVNDQLVLDVHGDDIRLSVVKRPRRARPAVTPSTWTSMQDASPTARDAGGKERGEGSAGADAASRDASRAAADPASPDGVATATTTPRGDTRDLDRRDARDAFGDPAEPTAKPANGRHDDGSHASEAAWRDDGRRVGGPHDGATADDADDDAPRAPRVRVKPLRADGRVVHEAAPTHPDVQATGDAPPSPRGNPLGGLLRAARGLFGGNAARRTDRDRAAEPKVDPPDWTRGWDESDTADDADVAPASTFVDDPYVDAPFGAARGDDHSVDATGVDDPRSQAARARSAGEDDATSDPLAGGAVYDGGAYDGAAYDDLGYDDSRDVDARFDEAGFDEAWRDPDPVGREGARVEAPTDAGGDPSGEVDAAAAAFPEPRTEPTPAVLPSGVPARAERFLAGDLRTRLLRFLSSPEMPLIAKTELIAKRFDLDEATAREMLEDVAEDPPDGLRLTPVRDGAWRIERTGG